LAHPVHFKDEHITKDGHDIISQTEERSVGLYKGLTRETVMHSRIE